MPDEQHTYKTGKVKWFDGYKGYGFIIPDDGGRDVMFHATICRVMRSIEIMDGDTVRYQDETGDGGRPRATFVEYTVPLKFCAACGKAR